jgi:hypothetical protein
MASPAFERHRAKTRARLTGMVLEFAAKPQDAKLDVATGLANPAKRLIFS